MRAMLPSASPSASLHCARSEGVASLELLQTCRPCLQQGVRSAHTQVGESQRPVRCPCVQGVCLSEQALSHLDMARALGHRDCSRCRCVCTSCTWAAMHAGCACRIVLSNNLARVYSPAAARAVAVSSHSCRLSLTGLLARSAHRSSAMEEIYLG